MKILFVRSSAFGSRLICSVLGEPASHVVFDFPSVGLAYHSFGTVRPDFSVRIRKNYTVVKEVWVPHADNIRFHGLFLDALNKKPIEYDVGALLYFGWRALLRYRFGLELGNTNPLDDPDRFLCTELALVFSRLYEQETGRRVLGEDELGMVTPMRLYELLKERI